MPGTEKKINTKDPAFIKDKRQTNKMIVSWIKCCERKKQTFALLGE